MMSKVTVIGAGNVGASVAQLLLERQLAREVVMVDIAVDPASGKALDLSQAVCARGGAALIEAGDQYVLSRGSDVIVITAGIPRKPGMSRDELLKTNAAIVSDVALKAYSHSPDAVFLVVSNPLDVMTYLVREVLELSASRVVGMAGVLDSARLKHFIAERLGYSSKDITAMVLGGHGDLMVPLPRLTTIGGIAISEFLSDDEIGALVNRTRQGGAEIVGLLKTGSAYYAPAAATVEMITAILRDEKRVLPCSVFPEGAYGLSELAIGLPAVLGRGGVEKVLEISLTEQEQKLLQQSAEAVKETIRSLENILKSESDG
ncbi:malate dehydrogenase [bacterium]|nr:malate dehydrogenase [bacterium]